MAGGVRANAQAVAVAGLAAGLTMTEVARQAGVSDRTIRRWLKRDAFRRRVEDARTELITGTVGKLADSAGEAVATLRQLLREGNPPATRLGAARVILEMASRYRESEELERRLTVLEEAVAAKEIGR